MSKKLSSDEFRRLYFQLPDDLKKSLGDEETGNTIHKICERNNVLDNLPDVIDLTGEVLLGILPLEKFQKSLETELNLDSKTAKSLYREIFRYVFYPVKESLAEIYKTDITPPTSYQEIMKPEAKTEKEDNYRETV